MNRTLKIFMILLGLCIWTSSVQAAAPSPATIFGVWKYSELIYRGQILPLPNPDLNLTWTFFDNGTERLHWTEKGETSFCERFAHYELRDDKIFETVFAINPRNGPECAKDPDMQVGRETSNKIEIQERQILFHMQMGDEEVVYILKKIP